jgi:hypothetical protein
MVRQLFMNIKLLTWFRCAAIRICALSLAMTLINACSHGAYSAARSYGTRFQPKAMARGHYTGQRAQTDLPLWKVESKNFPWHVFNKGQRATIEHLYSKLFPRYRRFLRAGLFGAPKPYFVSFVSESPEPPDYGGQSIDLAQCISTPRCKYVCSDHYEHGTVVLTAPGGRACEDGQLYFFTDINAPFPRGQWHPRTPAPCVRISGRAFGSCS